MAHSIEGDSTMKRLTWGLAFCVVAVAGVAGPARADVLYSNLGPGDSYVQDRGWLESAPDSAAGAVRQAIAFTAGGTDTLFDGARLALGLNRGANEMDLRLYDTAGGHPGAVLETIHASGQMPPFGQFGSGHLVTFDSATHPPLRAGETYWLLPLASGDTYAGWNMTNQGRNSPFAQSLEAEPTSWEVFPNVVQGAFEVNGTPSPAPEPSALALAGVGLVGAAGYVWRRRRKPAVA
jgi:LPXTG-motif cell wall-anchored protein